MQTPRAVREEDCYLHWGHLLAAASDSLAFRSGLQQLRRVCLTPLGKVQNARASRKRSATGRYRI